MDAVELPSPATIVTQIMRSSGCSGGAVTRVELVDNKSERESCSSSFRADKDNCNVNGSRPASGKTGKSNVSSSKRSRVAHMEASRNVTGLVDFVDLPKELGSCSGKYNVADKKPKTTVSGKRSDKRNGKVSKNKCDSFSVKVGLSSFSSAAGGNNILGVYGSKHDISDFGKQVDELSLNELLDGSYKCRNSVKENERKTEVLNGSILSSVRNACSILRFQKPIKTDGAANSSSFNKDGSNSRALTDNHTDILQFSLVTPKGVLDRLSLPTPKDLDLMLLDNMKPTSTSKVQNGGSLPAFPWSHVSGRELKSNPDSVKSTPSKSGCQGRWVKVKKSTTLLWEATVTSYLADFQSLTYNQSLVPLECQPSKSPMLSIRNTTSSDTRATDSKDPDVNSLLEVVAAQILCSIAAQCRKHDQDGTATWLKKTSQNVSRASKLTSDEKLEKALFAVPGSRPAGPTNHLINGPNDAKSHTQKKVNEKSNDLCKIVKTKRHESSSSSSSLKRSVTTQPAKLPNKPPKLRKLVPMEWKSRGEQKGNGK